MQQTIPAFEKAARFSTYQWKWFRTGYLTGNQAFSDTRTTARRVLRSAEAKTALSRRAVDTRAHLVCAYPPYGILQLCARYEQPGVARYLSATS